VKRKGLVILYTGNGKGKTTAAFGLALRSLGHGERVLVIQFIKSRTDCGELAIADKWKGKAEVMVRGSGFIRNKTHTDKLKAECGTAWQEAKERIASGKYSLVVLDELTYLINLALVEEDDVLECIAAKPAELHIVITGRDATQRLIDACDTVTEMKEVKHAYNSGVKAQRGIEW
jgi:cob(I)alamin adenosyltransferase